MYWDGIIATRVKNKLTKDDAIAILSGAALVSPLVVPMSVVMIHPVLSHYLHYWGSRMFCSPDLSEVPANDRLPLLQLYDMGWSRCMLLAMRQIHERTGVHHWGHQWVMSTLLTPTQIRHVHGLGDQVEMCMYQLSCLCGRIPI